MATENGNGHSLAEIQSHVNARRKHLEDILPKSMNVERFTKIVLQSIAKTPKLAQCSPESLYIAMHSAAQLGLEPNGPLGHAFLVPYWNNKISGYECQFQAGWRGLVALADRTCEIAVQAFVVRKGDKIRFYLGTNAHIEHESEYGNGEITHVYAVATLKNGRTQFEVMSAAEVNGIMQRTKSKDKEGNVVGPWRDDWSEMARKTVVKRLCKYLPISPDMADAIEADNRAEFEEFQVADVEPKRSRTQELKENLKNALPEETQTPVDQEMKQDQEKETSKRQGKKSKEVTQQQPQSQPEPTTPTVQPSQSTAAQASPVATETPKEKETKVEPKPAQENKSPIESDAVMMERKVVIGAGKVKYIDIHENAFYSESLPIEQAVDKAMEEKRKVFLYWVVKSERAVIVEAK